jgi:DNA-directed RNA polymerase specialized sigma24 family protein
MRSSEVHADIAKKKWLGLSESCRGYRMCNRGGARATIHMTYQDPQIASPSEVKEALLRLTDDELLRLKRVAQLRSSGLASVDWGDLLNEAVSRALSGTRAWPKAIPFLVFLVQTMRSIANEHWRQAHESVVVLAGDLDVHPEGESVNAVENLNPERQYLAKRTLRDIEAIFADDNQVLAILQGMALGLSAEEIRTKVGLSGKQYASAQRRIRRGIARAFMDKEQRLI